MPLPTCSNHHHIHTSISALSLRYLYLILATDGLRSVGTYKYIERTEIFSRKSQLEIHSSLSGNGWMSVFPFLYNPAAFLFTRHTSCLQPAACCGTDHGVWIHSSCLGVMACALNAAFPAKDGDGLAGVSLPRSQGAGAARAVVSFSQMWDRVRSSLRSGIIQVGEA